MLLHYFLLLCWSCPRYWRTHYFHVSNALFAKQIVDRVFSLRIKHFLFNWIWIHILTNWYYNELFFFVLNIEEFVSENKRLKGIGIGSPDGPLSLDDFRSLQRSNTVFLLWIHKTTIIESKNIYKNAYGVVLLHAGVKEAIGKSGRWNWYIAQWEPCT